MTDSEFDPREGRLWICVACTEPVANSEHKTPDECPECGGNRFGRVSEGKEDKYLGSE